MCFACVFIGHKSMKASDMPWMLAHCGRDQHVLDSRFAETSREHVDPFFFWAERVALL